MPAERASSTRRAIKGELLIPDDVVAYYERAQGDAFDASAARALFLIRALAQRINDVSGIWLAPFGLTPLSFQVVARLQAAPGHALALSALSRALHTRATTITSLVDGLERDGIVKRTAHATDRRATLAKLTRKGLQVASGATASQHRHITQIMSTISHGDRDVTIATLLHVGEALHREKLAIEKAPETP
jgi:DNA-binding MarR family transcriptional regulator